MAYKTHMVKYADDGDFTTLCGIDADSCSDRFKESVTLSDFGDTESTTCKNCIKAYESSIRKDLNHNKFKTLSRKGLFMSEPKPNLFYPTSVPHLYPISMDIESLKDQVSSAYDDHTKEAIDRLLRKIDECELIDIKIIGLKKQ